MYIKCIYYIILFTVFIYLPLYAICIIYFGIVNVIFNNYITYMFRKNIDILVVK